MICMVFGEFWLNDLMQNVHLHSTHQRNAKWNKKQTMALIIIAATTLMMNWFQRNCQEILRFNQPHANTHYTFVINFFPYFFLLFFSFYFFFLNTHTVFTYDSQFLTCVALFRYFVFFPWFSQLGLLCFLHWLFILYFCCIYLFTGCKRRREKKKWISKWCKKIASFSFSCKAQLNIHVKSR